MMVEPTGATKAAFQARAARVSGWAGLAAVGFGVLSAVLWFWSAMVTVPRLPGAVFDYTSPSDPFNVAMRQIGFRNTLAAGVTGFAALAALAERVLARLAHRL